MPEKQAKKDYDSDSDSDADYGISDGYDGFGGFGGYRTYRGYEDYAHIYGYGLGCGNHVDAFCQRLSRENMRLLDSIRRRNDERSQERREEEERRRRRSPSPPRTQRQAGSRREIHVHQPPAQIYVHHGRPSRLSQTTYIQRYRAPYEYEKYAPWSEDVEFRPRKQKQVEGKEEDKGEKGGKREDKNDDSGDDGP